MNIYEYCLLAGMISFTVSFTVTVFIGLVRRKRNDG